MPFNKEILNLYNNQDYLKIREECLQNNGNLWEDTSYKATFDKQINWEWKRPKDITSNPRFIKANSKGAFGTSRFDVNNIGQSNNESLTKYNLAVISALTVHPWVFRIIVPSDNSEFSDNNYAGLFHFRFWKSGKWYDIVVDDRLPTRDGKLVSFIKNGQEEELWPLLLDKAYTKFFGSEESFSRTRVDDFLVDITGGITEQCTNLGHLRSHSVDLDMSLYKALERQCLIIFCKHWQPTEDNVKLENIYCVTKAVYLDTEESKKKLMMRIFMPFKSEKSPWSEQPEELKSISEAKQKVFGIVNEHDGEFWIPFSEFNKHDWNIYIVHLNPHSIGSWGDEQRSKFFSWCVTTAENKWIKGITSGGNRREYLDTTFHLNPQYIISLKESDSESSDCTIIIALLQKAHKSERVLMDFHVYKINSVALERFDKDFFKHQIPITSSVPGDVSRQITKRFTIPPGDYCIVVAAQKPDYEAPFLLRVFTEKNYTLNKLSEKIVQKDIDVRASLALSLSERESVIIQESIRKVEDFFDDVSGEDKVVGWEGLKKVLDYAMDNEKPTSENYSVRNSLLTYIFPSNSVFDTMDKKEFSKEVTRSLFASADLELSGKLTFQEFELLWLQVRHWMQIYEAHSNDYGYLPKNNLREALDSAGFQLNSDVLSNLALRYANRDGVIPFDDFLICASKLKTMFDYFKNKDQDNTEKATFSFEEWLQNTIYS